MPMLARRPALLAGLAAGLPLAGARRARAQASDARDIALGDPAAPVTMIEYFSLTCPHCAAFHADTLPGLKQRYLDTGKVRLVLRDFPLDQNAAKAAVVARCAGPERYPAFVAVFLERQQGWARAADPVPALKQLARLGGLGEGQIDACLADPKIEEAVLQSRLDGQKRFDVRSTPTFVVGGKAYPGTRSVEGFAELIEPLLPKD